MPVWIYLLSHGNSSNWRKSEYCFPLPDDCYDCVFTNHIVLFNRDKRAAASEENLKLLHELYVADPEAEMQLLENRKDKILDEAFDWILETKEYKALVSWEEEEECRMLWVRGPAGTGKTMLVMGIVKQLSRPSPSQLAVHHFFCQGTNALFNKKTSVIRSLMWQLLKNQCRLISHLKAKFGHTPKPWFSAVGEQESQFLMLCNAFEAMLQDPDLKQCYLVVDALDECSQSIEMMTQITAFAAATDRVKWLISSRPEVVCDEEGADMARFRVEIDSQVLEAPVRKYIEHKLSSLSSTYVPEVLDGVSKEIKAKAENTFLWVWFVFQELNSKHKNGRRRMHGDLLSVVRKFPSGLEAAYKRIMDLIEDDDDSMHVDHCKHCLDAVYLAERPMTTSEMAAILFISNEEMGDVILSCGSFLGITQPSKIISFIHQSAKDYLTLNRFDKESEGTWKHIDMARQSLKALSNPRPGYTALHTNMYNLDHFGPVGVSEPQECMRLEPLVSLRYAAFQFIAHLDKAGSMWREALSDESNGIIYVFLQKHLLDWIEACSFDKNSSRNVFHEMTNILYIKAGPISTDQAIHLRGSYFGGPPQVHLYFALFYPSKRYAGTFCDSPAGSILRGNTARYQHLKIVVETSKRFKQARNAEWPKNQWHAHYRQDKTLDIQDLETGEITKSFRLDWLEAEHSLAKTESTEFEDSATKSEDDDDTLGYLSPGSVFLSQGQWFAASYSKTVAKVWNLGEKQCIAEYRFDRLSDVVFAALSSDGTSIAWYDSSQRSITYRKSGDLVGTKLLIGGGLSNAILVSSISSDKKWLASVSSYYIIVWNLDTFKKTTWPVQFATERIARLSFSDDGKVLSLRLNNGTVKTFCNGNEDQQQATAHLSPPQPSAKVEVSENMPSISYEHDWVEIHGEEFLLLPREARIWPSKVGNRMVIDSDESVVTITCECPSCMEAFV